MKLTYTEFRPSVNRSTVEELAVIKGYPGMTVFRNAILEQIGVCMDNDAQDLAHKLIDWHRACVDKGLTSGDKLVYPYGTGLDPVGTYELTE
jgi:hypothetical protein